MRTCLACQQPIPTLQDFRHERRRHWTIISVVVVLVLLIGGSIGYLMRDGIFLKRENSTLSSLLDSYVKRVETDKIVDANAALKAEARRAKGYQRHGGSVKVE